MQPRRRRNQRLIALNLSNVRDFFAISVLKVFISVQKKRKESRCLVFTFSIKREIKKFHVVVVPVTAKKCTKIRNARAKLLFAYKAPSHVSVFV